MKSYLKIPPKNQLRKHNLRSLRNQKANQRDKQSPREEPLPHLKRRSRVQLIVGKLLDLNPKRELPLKRI